VTAIDATERLQRNEYGAMLGENRNAELRHSTLGFSTAIVPEARVISNNIRHTAA
jgi:hypothetical protein